MEITKLEVDYCSSRKEVKNMVSLALLVSDKATWICYWFWRVVVTTLFCSGASGVHIRLDTFLSGRWCLRRKISNTDRFLSGWRDGLDTRLPTLTDRRGCLRRLWCDERHQRSCTSSEACSWIQLPERDDKW